jgi:hypothetical protein
MIITLMLPTDTAFPFFCSANWLVEVFRRRGDQAKAPEVAGAKITLPERVMGIQLRLAKMHRSWVMSRRLAKRQ